MTHVLETDGVSTHLFQCLAKDTRRLEAARVFIPTTIVFEGGFAANWYYSTAQMEVKQQNLKSITANMVYDEFVPEGDHCTRDVVALFVEVTNTSESTGKGPAKPILTAYFSPTQLKEFLYSPGQKPRGILQKFDYPKGWCSTTIQATWSPSVTVAEGVRNPYSLSDHGRSANQRCSTFESKLATPVALSNIVSAGVKKACELVVSHIQQVEPIQISGMILHLKVTATNRVQILYSTCIRAVGKNALVSSDSRPVACNQVIMTREDWQEQEALKAHLSMFGPQRIRGATKADAAVQGNPATTRDSPNAMSRKSRLPRLSCDDVSPVRQSHVYLTKATQCCSAIVAPRMLPSMMQIGGRRWLPAGGKLEPIVQGDIHCLSPELHNENSQRFPGALLGGFDKGPSQPQTQSIEDEVSSSNQQVDSAVDLIPKDSSACASSETESLRSSFEDIVYAVSQAAHECKSFDAFTKVYCVQGRLAVDEVLQKIFKVFQGFEVVVLQEPPLLLDGTFTLNAHGQGASPPDVYIAIHSPPLTRSGAMAAANVRLRQFNR
jgi:hypothetical protein